MKTPPHTWCLAVARGSCQIEVVQQFFPHRSAKKVTLILYPLVVSKQRAESYGLQSQTQLACCFQSPSKLGMVSSFLDS